MKSFLILVLIFLSAVSQAKVDSLSTKKNSFYLELLGIAGYASLNFEREFIQIKKVKIGARLGISTYNFTDFTAQFNPDIIIPLSINALYGNKHNLELGLGQVISALVKANSTTFSPERSINIHPNFTIGYRYQKSSGGFMYRINYSPIIEFYKEYKHWGGISIGYTF